MSRVWSLGIILFFVGNSVSSERVLSRERSFIAPSLVVRNEVKRDPLPTPKKIPVSSPKIISLTARAESKNQFIIARPIDLVFIDTVDLKYSQNSYYSIDGGPFLTALGSINLPKQGIYQLTFYSVDFFGNRDTGKTRTLIVDPEPPKLKLQFSPTLTFQGERQICAHAATISITANDQLSGIKAIFWKLSSEEVWKRFENPIPVRLEKDEDSFSIDSYAVDNAGNVSQPENIICYADISLNDSKSETGKIKNEN